jgi:hypothetical protein
LSRRWVGGLIGGSIVAIGGVLVGLYVEPVPAGVAATSVGPHRAALVLQTVGAIGHGPNPDWVSYYARDPSGRWVH